MKRRAYWLWAGCLWGILNSSAAAASLAGYLLRPADQPSDCRPVQGFYPLDQKVGLFYEYKTYRVAVPPAIDRHAQSFQCGTQTGTLYFFLYRQSEEAETAERFARGIFSRLAVVPAIENFPNGFIVLSFKEMPPSLLDSLKRKLLGSVKTLSPLPPPVQAAVIRSAPPEPPVSSIPKISTAAVAVSSPPPAVPEPLPPLVSKDSKTSLAPDLSDDVLTALIKELDCRAKNVQAETREACDLFSSFKKGSAIEPVIAAQTPRVGVGYQVNSFGQLNARSYLALAGSGRPRDAVLVPLPVNTGVEDLEVQALIAARREGKPLPASNEMTERIFKYSRPAQPTLLATTGDSWLLSSGAQKKGFIRKAGDQWILIIVNGENATQQTRSDVIVAGLY